MRSDFVLGLSSTGFHRMHYVEWGDPAAERVVICVHGLTRNGRDFDELAQALLPDFRVVCPDVVGRGTSEWLQAKDAYGTAQYCADMTALSSSEEDRLGRLRRRVSVKAGSRKRRH